MTHLGPKGLFDSRDSKLELRMSIGAPCSPLFIVQCLLVSRAGLDKGILFLRLLYLIWDKLIPWGGWHLTGRVVNLVRRLE